MSNIVIASYALAGFFFLAAIGMIILLVVSNKKDRSSVVALPERTGGAKSAGSEPAKDNNGADKAEKPAFSFLDAADESPEDEWEAETEPLVTSLRPQAETRSLGQPANTASEKSAVDELSRFQTRRELRQGGK